jgi:hypothetical protein
MPEHLPRNWIEMRREWPGLTAYQRFEAFVVAFRPPGKHLMSSNG